MSDPVQPRERLVTLDVLRGIALCGVMIGNMVLYSGRWAGDSERSSSILDMIAGLFVHVFVDSKAQTLLTLLFGFGFAIQLLRAEARGEPIVGIYVRRLLALFVLGALHVYLLWWGDVTWTYAVAGVGMLAFIRASNLVRVVVGILFIFVPFLLQMAFPEIGAAAVSVFMEPREMRTYTEAMLAAMHSPDHAGLGVAHVTYALAWVANIYVWYFLWTLGRFLLGYIAGQRRWFERDGADHLVVFRRLALWGGLVGLATIALDILAMVGVFSLREFGTAGRLTATALQQVHYLAMALAYVGIVVLLMQRRLWRRLLGILAPVGRMPLTTYFMQSVVCTFIFYGWGLGWAGEVGIAGCLGLALSIFAVQIVIAHVWLHYFRFGPLEWVWRMAVYLKPQRMR
ncbi:MAG: DUF418 domain-containing protein [Kofleriaceae bacterium]